MRNFYSALAQANLLYDIELSEDDFAEYGLIAWELIGNKNVQLYRYRAKINCEDLSIDLPCNCDIIEAVTYDWEDWNYTTNVHNNGDIHTAYVEMYDEVRKQFKDPLYVRGRFAKYERVGDKLYFDKNYGYVNILYKGILLDDNGLPELTDKEVDAIATYVTYILKFKEGLITNNPNIIQLANVLKQDWQVKCDRARTPDYINQNEMNAIIDAKSNWDRHRYNKSTKPIR